MKRWNPVVAGVVVLLFGPALPCSAAAQPTARARSAFATVLDAADALLVIDPQPGDANGELRRWDRRWRRRLERFQQRPVVRARCMGSTRCVDREVCELVAWMTGAASEVLRARRGMLRDPNHGYGGSREALSEMAWSLALRRLTADEAARRRAEDLSCEDLPLRETHAWSQNPDARGLYRLHEALDARALLAFARGALPGLEAELRGRG